MQQTPAKGPDFLERAWHILVWLAAIAGGVLAIAGLLSLLWTIGRWVYRRIRPFGGSYKLLRELELGVQRGYLKAKFGEPAVGHDIVGPVDNQLDSYRESSYRCDIYRGTGHIIGTLSDGSGSVSAIAVASTADNFRGALSLPIGRIVLNKTTMGQMCSPSRVVYSVGGSGGFNYYVLDVLDGQCNAARYRDHLWGRIYGPELRDDLREISGGDPLGGYTGDYSSSLDAYRNRWPVNVEFISHVPLDKV